MTTIQLGFEILCCGGPIPFTWRPCPKCGVAPIDDRYALRILTVCEAIHGSEVGTGDALPEHELKLLRDWLFKRLDTWTPSKGEASAYDEAIKNLMKVTLVCHGAPVNPFLKAPGSSNP